MRQNKKDQGIADVVSNFGFAFEVLKVIAHAVMAKGGNMQHLRRIVKEPALQRQIADLIVPAGSEIERPLGENEYLVPVAYDMPRNKGTLEGEFSKDGVSELFYGNYEWKNHSSCAEIDQTPGEHIMLVKHFNRAIESEDAIAEMDKLGYRPATHLEAYAFAKANPELQRQFWIVALGSSTVCDGDRFVAVLDGCSGRRVLDGLWFDDEWDSDRWFLFIRSGAGGGVGELIRQARRPKPVEQPQGSHPCRGVPTNGSSPFSAPVVYVQPAFEELKRRFPAYVNLDYKGKRFDPIERCKGVSTENREVAFEYVHMDRDASTDEVLAEMDRKGLRPALYEELLGFAEKYPDEQRKYPIVALGSGAHVHGGRRVAYLWDDDDSRNLYLYWIGGDWDDHCRFLAVRK